jgi:hypothetical protein
MLSVQFLNEKIVAGLTFPQVGVGVIWTLALIHVGEVASKELSKVLLVLAIHLRMSMASVLGYMKHG